MNRKPIDAQPLTSIEEDRIRQSVHRHAFGWQQTSRLLATLDALLDERDAAVSARQEAERVLERIANAIEAEMAMVGPESKMRQFDRGAAAAYNFVLSHFPGATLARTREPAGEAERV